MTEQEQKILAAVDKAQTEFARCLGRATFEELPPNIRARLVWQVSYEADRYLRAYGFPFLYNLDCNKQVKLWNRKCEFISSLQGMKLQLALIQETDL